MPFSRASWHVTDRNVIPEIEKINHLNTARKLVSIANANQEPLLNVIFSAFNSTIAFAVHGRSQLNVNNQKRAQISRNLADELPTKNLSRREPDVA